MAFIMKKQTKKQLDKIEKKKLNNLWKETREKVLERDNYQCILCGAKKGDTYINKKGKEIKVKLDVHHLLEKEFILFRYLKFDIRNLVTVCAKCHKYSEFSIHKNPIYSLEVVKKKYINNYKYLLSEVNRLHKEIYG
jgi:5-methylcytosine-specific restriction endonuclease McrA